VTARRIKPPLRTCGRPDGTGSAEHLLDTRAAEGWIAGGSHPLWTPDGQSLYFDRNHQMFRLAVNTKDMSSRIEPTPLPIKGFAQAEYRRQFDLMPDGRQFLMLFPVSAR
jgi:hypothetical protein